jgi:hypothetical protein
MLLAVGAVGMLMVTSAGCGGDGATTDTAATPSASGASTGAGSPGATSPTSASPGVTSALASTLTDAYRSETAAAATYANVLARLGQVRPFVNIHQAELQHVTAVKDLLSRYAVPVPASAAGEPSPATLHVACQLGVSIETAVVSLYRDSLPRVQAYADVTNVLTNLMNVSRDNHLPAFQHC